MNKNNIVDIMTKEAKILFISIPYSYKDFKIEQYNIAGAYLMETAEQTLNHWKVKIPNGNYEIIGRSHELSPDVVEGKIKLKFNKYLRILNQNDITISYSDNSNFWLVVIQK